MLESFLSQVPTFSSLFKPAHVRYVFRKKKNPKPRPSKRLLFLRMKHRIAKADRRCCERLKCLANVTDGFLDDAASWQNSWILTPRKQKRSALMDFLIKCQKCASSRSTKSLESKVSDAAMAKLDGRDYLALQAGEAKQTEFSFLGRECCERSFRIFTGTQPHWFLKQIRKGSLTYVEKPINRQSPATTAMINAMWIIIQELHHQSPYAKALNQPNVWIIPFHQKVCLWRLIQKTHEQRKADSSKPPLFEKEPSYQLFKKCLLRDEFKNVQFHRMVDIGRCPKCEYFSWKCSSVAIELRAVWQEALAKHHLLQLEQKRIYSIDRARAAAEFPHHELYLAILAQCGGVG